MLQRFPGPLRCVELGNRAITQQVWRCYTLIISGETGRVRFAASFVRESHSQRTAGADGGDHPHTVPFYRRFGAPLGSP